LGIFDWGGEGGGEERGEEEGKEGTHEAFFLTTDGDGWRRINSEETKGAGWEAGPRVEQEKD
jgi:hypothetical protein